jgi:hypothetical protein
MKAFSIILRRGPRAVALYLSALTGAFAQSPQAAGGMDNASVNAGLTPDGGRIIVEARGMPAPAPLFFSAAVDQVVRVGALEIAGEMRIHLHVLQGKPEVMTLGLSGDGDVVDVSGVGLGDWSVRRAAGSAGETRFLDLHPQQSAGLVAPRDFDIIVRSRVAKPAIPGSAAIMIATPGNAASFTSTVALSADPDVDLRATSARGLVAIEDSPDGTGPAHFYSTGDGRLEVSLSQRGAAAAGAELVGSQLSGLYSPAGASVDFRLRGQLRARMAGARLRLLSGRAALSEGASGDGWHVELVPADGGGFAYDLVGERAGLMPVDIRFAAGVRQDGDWRKLDFSMPAGVVVPILMDGLGTGVSFDPDSSIMPVATKAGWQGYLQSDGAAAISWKATREAEKGALAFTSSEQTEVRVGSGLLRESARISFRILQGRLGGIRCRIEGPGEILSVEGTNVVGWKVEPEGTGHALVVSLSRPVEGEGRLTVNSQAELGSFPARIEPMRLVPEGGVRHSGFLRISNSGSVRLEVADAAGMMQLAPAQFPGAALENARQVLVYRFPSEAYGYRIVASEIRPEVGVSEVATYEFSETERVINASIEIDVREAPLRDWSVQVPEDFTIASVEGAGVADYAAETASIGGYRTLKVIFDHAIEGRQLLRLRLEKNQPAAPGSWRLPALRFPGAKSVRGSIGAVAAPGFRLFPAKVAQLTEVPVSYFPSQVAGLQQAWRLRDPEWTAELGVEALGQSVSADVFHLYSIKEGIVYGSVLVNYFVVGAPATEWRLEVPASVGNIDVVGQNVQRDWRRDGNQVIVTLHRPVLGGATLLVTFEQPMSARGGTIEPSEVRPLGVQSERGYVEVVSPLQVKFDVRKSEGGLLKLEAAELPAELRLLSSSPALALYQYTARPFRLEMGVEWYPQAETADQVVDFATLSSQVSRDGQVITDARYFVKTRGRKALRLTLPPGVNLWETRVDNEVTSAQVDGSEILIPLAARANPNEPACVSIRVGQPAGSGTWVSLVAPRVDSSTVVAEWTVRGDPGLVLAPRGGTARLVRPALTESGFEWISNRGRVAVASLLGVVLLGALFLLGDSASRIMAGLACCVAAMAGGSMMAADSMLNRRPNLRELRYAWTMVSQADDVSIKVANVTEWRALIVGWGVAAAAVGVALAAASFASRGRRSPLARLGAPAACVLLAYGLLAQHGGAVLFFAALCAGVFLLMFIPGAARWQAARRAERSLRSPDGIRPSAGIPVLALVGALGLALGASPGARADGEPASWQQAASKPAQAMVETWRITNHRLFAEVDVTVRGGPGDSFLLLRPPAILTDFKGDGLRVGKLERDGQTSYYIAPEREGSLTAHARFEMPVADPTKGVAVPTGPAATQRISLELDQGGWDFASSAAVQILPTQGLGEGRSGATLVLAPGGEALILLRPRSRDVGAEATRFFAEAANLYVPGPGVVDGYSRVTVRPVQGRVSELDLEVPKGLTVGDVIHGPVGAWRFDPQKRLLHISVEPAQADAFRFDVQTQLGAGALPFGLSLEPLRVDGAAGQVGTIAIAFGPEAQPESVVATGISPVSVQDFDATLVPRAHDRAPVAAIQQVWRYGQSGGHVDMRVAAVAPEVRVASRQVLSLDDDRLVMAVDLNVSITRAGLFKLSFAVPDGMELEALSGRALSQWTEGTEAGRRIITMQLNGRTLGDEAFALTLTGAAPRSQDSWSVPRLSLREAGRQTGDLLLVPGKGLRLRVADRARATQVDPASLGGLQPGTLAFHLLQGDWELHLGIEALDPWVTVQALEEVTVREGQRLTRIGVHYRVENAAVKQFRIGLPGLRDDDSRTIRATGPAVSDIVRVAGSADLWDIHLQRGIAGETDVQIEYQGPAAPAADREMIRTPEFPGAREVAQFVAIRAGGRLELEAGNPPRGWSRADWGAVGPNLQSRSDRSVPALCFRVAEPEGALAVIVRRHDIADALKLSVARGELTTVFSPGGSSLTSVELKVDVLEKSTLRVRLPEGARLFNTFVNGEGAAVVREGDAYLFHVSANTEQDHSASVRLAYSVPGTGAGGVALSGPSLSVPLENMTWRVVLPPGYDLIRYQGGLQLRGEQLAGWFGIDQYQSLVGARRASDARKAVAMLEEANAFLQSGDQQKAAEMFSRASNANLDEASNEDARVQLRVLKNQQTLLGLNTRRQRMYLDNRADSPRNEQMEQAASMNPFMRGGVNFDPQQVDQLLMGNTAEENTALRGIASHLVDQQLAAETAPAAIDVTLPERGRVLTFTSSLQVNGDRPLSLRLSIGKLDYANLRFCAFTLLAVAAIAALSLRRPRAPAPETASSSLAQKPSTP